MDADDVFRPFGRPLGENWMQKTKKTSTTKKGAKTRTKRTAGKTARKATGLQRTVKGWVAAVVAREKRTPGFRRALRDALDAEIQTSHIRAAQVRPRTNAPEPATTH